jgi:hypothetical protein
MLFWMDIPVLENIASRLCIFHQRLPMLSFTSVQPVAQTWTSLRRSACVQASLKPAQNEVVKETPSYPSGINAILRYTFRQLSQQNIQ